MAETRIEATDRLRREGRWTAAWEFKEAERKRLRAEGVGRKESVNKSWDLMLAEYPPAVDEKGYVACLGMGEFPPASDALEVLEPQYSDAWRAYCRLLAICCRLRPGLYEAKAAIAAGVRRMLDEPPPATRHRPTVETRGLIAQMFDDPVRFLDWAECRFSDAQDLLQEAGGQEAEVRELGCVLDGLDALGEVVRSVWPIEKERRRQVRRAAAESAAE